MPRKRINYPVQFLFAGPAPASGFHFIDGDGGLNNDYLSSGNINLLQQIDRVNSMSYSIDISPALLKQLGTKSLMARPVIEYPQVGLNFEYYINSIKNEARLGFDVNYRTGNNPFYSSRVCPISGLISRELYRMPDNIFWTHTHKDARNLFFVIDAEGGDVITDGIDYNLTDSGKGVNSENTGWGVISFGSCYATSYEMNARVGAIPTAKLSYICDNIQFNTSGNGIHIPYIDKITAVPHRIRRFSLPKAIDEGGATVLLPGDIDITLSGNGKIYDIGTDFNDAKIQSFNISIPLNREPLPMLGAKLPIDRQIDFPVLATISFEYLFGDTTTGRLDNFFTGDSTYNLTIGIKNNTGCQPTNRSLAIQYDVFNAVLKSHSSSLAVGGNKVGNVNFEVELDPDNLNRGLFISGVCNIDTLNSVTHINS